MIPIADENRRPGFPLVVYGLIALNLVVFVQEFAAPSPDRFIAAFALIPYDVTHGIVLAPPSPPLPAATLVTSQFIHASLLHVGANMLFLFVFGPDVESLFGHGRFLAFYLGCGIVAALAQISVSPGSHVPSLGASGAIAGVLGAYVVTFPRNTIATIVPLGCLPLFFRVPALLIIGLWAASQFFAGFGSLGREASGVTGGVAYFAHIGGFLAGVLTAGFLRPAAVTRRYRGPR